MMYLRRGSLIFKHKAYKFPCSLLEQPYLRYFSTNKSSDQPPSPNPNNQEKKDSPSPDKTIPSQKSEATPATQESEEERFSFKDLTFLETPKSKQAKLKDDQAPPTVVRFDAPDGYKINTEVEFQLKDNPLALKVMKEGKIDLRDKRIEVNTLSMADASLLDPNSLGEIKQINLGDIKVVPKDSVMLEDIDVYNIPEDKDIVIEKEEKTLFAVGKKVKRKESLKIVKEGEEGEEAKGKEMTGAEKDKEAGWIQEVGKKIFEEKSFEEFKKENLFFSEGDFVRFNYKELMRAFLGLIPALLFSTFVIHTIMEVYACKKDDMLIEEQEMENLVKIRSRHARNVLLNNPLFDRRTLAKAAKKEES